jgi:large repetitive protein
VLNSSFETWTTDTAFFTGFGYLGADTFTFSDPVDWTTTNALSGADTFGGLAMVTQSSDAHSGTSAMQIVTASFDTVTVLGQTRQLTIPGLAINGDFPLNIPSGVIIAGGTISPVLIPGAGQPVTERLGNIKGWYKYTPVAIDTAGNLDTCMVWATLKKGTEIVANAIFKNNTRVNAYTEFSAPFEYVSCSIPDTLVILVASSVPTLGNLFLNTGTLVPGSVLLVDDLSYDTLSPSFAFPPIARDDYDTVPYNGNITIDVKANDDDCDNPGFPNAETVNATAAVVGVTSVSAGMVTYQTSVNYSGLDSFTYTLTDAANHTSTVAKVRVFVEYPSGISEANQIPVSVFPVPASDELTIKFENTGRTTLSVFDVAGKLVATSILTKNYNTLRTTDFANGIYSIQLSNEKNAVIARSKFTVSK